jgi:long-chain fatty acid transport protein
MNVHLPQTVVVGYSYRPSPNWNLEVDADWTDWTSLRDTTVKTAPIPGRTLAFNWKPSTIYEFGVTRNLGNGWHASAGYMYSENSVPNSSFNPLVPDSDRHIFSLGVGKSYRHLSWEAAYQIGYGPARSVTADNNSSANGSYEFFSNALSINVGWHF